MLERIRQIVRKEFIQVLNDPRMRVTLFVTPLIQLLVFGYAVTMDVRNIRTVIYDQDHTPASRELVSRLQGSGFFNIFACVSDARDAQEHLDRGTGQLIVRMGPGFGGDIAAGRPASLQVIVDGTDSNTAGIILSYLARIVDAFSRDVLLVRMQHVAGGAEQIIVGVELKSRAWFNENLESRNFFLPAIVVHLVTLTSLILTSMAIVRERENGTMEQIMVTPIRPAEFVLGKTLPFGIISLADVAVITVVGVFWFNVPIRGNIVLLFAAAILYLFTTLGTGLIISTIARTQQQANMSTFFFYFPAFLLSGFVYPVENMPQVVQWITYANPVRYALVIVRGIFLKGVGLSVLWPQMAVLLGMGIFTIFVAAKRFRKTLA